MSQPLIYWRWPPRHPERIQIFSINSPNGIKIGTALEETGRPYEPHVGLPRLRTHHQRTIVANHLCYFRILHTVVTRHRDWGLRKILKVLPLSRGARSHGTRQTGQCWRFQTTRAP